MPGGDGTGPLGVGPISGRGLGPCNSNNQGLINKQIMRQGMGRGMGRGKGFGINAKNLAQPKQDQVIIQEKNNTETNNKNN